MIGAKIYLDDKKIVFKVNKDCKDCVRPSGEYKGLLKPGFRTRTTIINKNKIVISKEAKIALKENLIDKFDYHRLSRDGDFAIYPTIEEKQDILISWKPKDPAKDPNFEMDLGSKCSIDTRYGFKPELIDDIKHVYDNELIKKSSFDEINKKTELDAFSLKKTDEQIELQ